MTILPVRRRRLALIWPSLVFALVAFVAVAAHPDPARAIGENVETFTLDNGLEVVVIPDRRAPVVTHMVWYRVGAADEAPGESGVRTARFPALSPRSVARKTPSPRSTTPRISSASRKSILG